MLFYFALRDALFCEVKTIWCYMTRNLTSQWFANYHCQFHFKHVQLQL